MGKITFTDDVIYHVGKVRKPKDEWEANKLDFNTTGDCALKLLNGQWFKERNMFDSDDFYYGGAVRNGLFPEGQLITIATKRPNGKDYKIETEGTITRSNNQSLGDNVNNQFPMQSYNMSKDHQNYLKEELAKKEEKIRFLENKLYDLEKQYSNSLNDIRMQILTKEGEIIKAQVSQAKLEETNKWLNEKIRTLEKELKDIDEDRHNLNATLQDENRTSAIVNGAAAFAPILGDLVKAWTQSIANNQNSNNQNQPVNQNQQNQQPRQLNTNGYPQPATYDFDGMN